MHHSGRTLAQGDLPALTPDGMVADASAEPNIKNQRDGERLSLLIRSAKLVCPAGEYLCIVRDVSETGVRLRLFHPLPTRSNLTLELSSGERFDVTCVWESDTECGLRFHQRIDVHAFLEEPSPYPKRPVRLRLECEAQVLSGGLRHTVVIRDLSRQGALIDSHMPLSLDQNLILIGPGLPELDATVRWRQCPAHGLALGRIFSFEELAGTVARLQARNPPVMQG